MLTMTQPAKIDNDCWYDDGQLFALGISTAALSRARKGGTIKFRRAGRGGRNLYLGRWVTDWLTGEPTSEREVAHAC
jgi:hypothetical protein